MERFYLLLVCALALNAPTASAQEFPIPDANGWLNVTLDTKGLMFGPIEIPDSLQVSLDLGTNICTNDFAYKLAIPNIPPTSGVYKTTDIERFCASLDVELEQLSKVPEISKLLNLTGTTIKKAEICVDPGVRQTGPGYVMLQPSLGIDIEVESPIIPDINYPLNFDPITLGDDCSTKLEVDECTAAQACGWCETTKKCSFGISTSGPQCGHLQCAACAWRLDPYPKTPKEGSIGVECDACIVKDSCGWAPGRGVCASKSPSTVDNCRPSETIYKTSLLMSTIALALHVMALIYYVDAVVSQNNAIKGEGNTSDSRKASKIALLGEEDGFYATLGDEDSHYDIMQSTLNCVSPLASSSQVILLTIMNIGERVSWASRPVIFAKTFVIAVCFGVLNTAMTIVLFFKVSNILFCVSLIVTIAFVLFVARVKKTGFVITNLRLLIIEPSLFSLGFVSKVIKPRVVSSLHRDINVTPSVHDVIPRPYGVEDHRWCHNAGCVIFRQEGKKEYSFDSVPEAQSVATRIRQVRDNLNKDQDGGGTSTLDSAVAQAAQSSGAAYTSPAAPASPQAAAVDAIAASVASGDIAVSGGIDQEIPSFQPPGIAPPPSAPSDPVGTTEINDNSQFQ